MPNELEKALRFHHPGISNMTDAEHRITAQQDYIRKIDHQLLEYQLDNGNLKDKLRESDQRIQGLTLQNDALKSKLREIDSIIPRGLL